MSKLFILRDDDLNYFSKSEDIAYWYQNAFSRGIPVSFSTIPFVKGVSDVYTKGATDPAREYAVGSNLDLIKYIKNNDATIEITQHGCTHETVNGVYEFGRKQGLIAEAHRGYGHLNNIFGDIKVFVAPHDTLSNHGVRAVESIGLNIIRSKGMRNFLPRFQYIINFLKMIRHRLRYPNRHTASAYPYVLNFGKHKEAYSHRLIKDRSQMMSWLHEAYLREGNFILVNHIHDRDDHMRVLLYAMLDEAQKLGFRFAKASDLFI